MNRYEVKQEARRERLLGAADKAQARASQAFQRADLREEASGIPFGQPILVGHHSEGRHRRIIARAEAAMGRAVAESKRAEELRHKAASVGTGGISSDDPEAGDKLAEQVAKLEAKQARMKAANATIRKHAKAGRVAQMVALMDMGYPEVDAHKLVDPDLCGRIGYPNYAISNNNANIRRLKARIPRVQAIQAAEEVSEQFGDIEYREDEGRVWLVFPGKPADAIRADLRSHAFKWSPTRGAWVRQMSDDARYQGRKIAGGAA